MQLAASALRKAIMGLPWRRMLHVTKGEGTLKEYKFGPKTMGHQFCGVCGTSVLGKRMVRPGLGMDIGVM